MTKNYQEEDLKVWYIPQVPMPAFEVEILKSDPAYSTLTDTHRLRLAAKILDTLTEFSDFEYHQKVKPDFSDVGGIMRWESDAEGGFDWFEVDDYEIEVMLEQPS